MTTFDPYHKWLGIPPAEQPPNHYRLLAIPFFESDPDVIANAADRQMVHIKSFQTGQHSALSQKILNQIAAAKVCLLKPANRAAYDAALRRELASTLPTGASVQDQPGKGLDLESLTSPAVAQRPHPPGRKNASWQPLVAVGASVVVLVVIVIFAMTRDGEDKRARPKTRGPLIAQVKPAAAKPTEKPKVKLANREPEPKQYAPIKNVEPEHKDVRPDDRHPQPEPEQVTKHQDTPAAETPGEAEKRLKQTLANAKTTEEYRSVAQDSLKVFEQAVAGGQTDLSKRMATMALVAARKAHDSTLAEDAVVSLLTGKRRTDDTNSGED